MPLFVSFIYEADQSTKQIAREILLKVTNADVDFIKPTTVCKVHIMQLDHIWFAKSPFYF